MITLIFSILLSAAVPATQLSKVGELKFASDFLATGVSLEGTRAHVSLFTGGVQWVVDCSNPASPVAVTSFNPAFGDQFGEHLYSANRMFMGHRFGGLNFWDVSGVPFQRDSVSTDYHFDGLALHELGAQKVLFYSEVAGGLGGLIVYDVTAGTLNHIGEWLQGSNILDGRFLVATGDKWVYQFDGGGGTTRPLMLNVYNCTNFTSPTLVQQASLGNVYGNYSGITDLQLNPTESILYAACDLDGLRVVDISTRAAPVVVKTFAARSYRARELDWLEGTDFMVVSARLPYLRYGFHIYNCANPLNPIRVGGMHTDPGLLELRDVKAVYLAGVPTVLVVGTTTSFEAVFQIWQ